MAGQDGSGTPLSRALRTALLRQRRGDRATHRGRRPFIFERKAKRAPAARARAIEALTRCRASYWPRRRRGAAPENRRHSLSALRVYLETSWRRQAHRVRLAENRPLLTAATPPRASDNSWTHARRCTARSPDITVSTDGRRVHSVAEQILRELARRAPHSRRTAYAEVAHVYCVRAFSAACRRGHSETSNSELAATDPIDAG